MLGLVWHLGVHAPASHKSPAPPHSASFAHCLWQNPNAPLDAEPTHT
jgi:hypothetical protein